MLDENKVTYQQIEETLYTLKVQKHCCLLVSQSLMEEQVTHRGLSERF